VHDKNPSNEHSSCYNQLEYNLLSCTYRFLLLCSANGRINGNVSLCRDSDDDKLAVLEKEGNNGSRLFFSLKIKKLFLEILFINPLVKVLCGALICLIETNNGARFLLSSWQLIQVLA